MKKLMLVLMFMTMSIFSQDTVTLEGQISELEIRHDEIVQEVGVITQKIEALDKERSKLILEKVNIEYAHPILMELLEPVEIEEVEDE